ncbi:unnamed protein product [Closterium sp. Yama58-4]|nr:unnamed protein product [Closterium sp. Yama58-4]
MTSHSCSSRSPATFCGQQLKPAHTIRVGGSTDDPDYVLQTAVSSISPLLAASTSAPAIKSFDVASGASLGDVAARHPGTVTDLGFAEAAFGGAGPGKEVLLSSSSESAVYVWDARARSQAGVFPAYEGAGELWSCSGGGGSTGHLLAAGGNSQVRCFLGEAVSGHLSVGHAVQPTAGATGGRTYGGRYSGSLPPFPPHCTPLSRARRPHLPFDLSPPYEASLSASTVTTTPAEAERYADSDPLQSVRNKPWHIHLPHWLLWPICLCSLPFLSPPTSLWDLWTGDPIASFDEIRSTLSEKWPLQVPVDYLITCDYSPSPNPRLRLFAGSHLGHAAAFPISLPPTFSNPSHPAAAVAAAAASRDDDAMMTEHPHGSTSVSVPPGTCQVSGPDMLLSGAHSGVVRDVVRVAPPASHAALSSGTAVTFWTGGEDGCLCQWEGIEGQEEEEEEEGLEDGGVKGSKRKGKGKDRFKPY